MIVRQSQFRSRTQHSLRFDATQLGFLDFDATGQGCAGLCQRRLQSLGRIRGAANNLHGFSTGIHLAHPELIGIGVGYCRDNLGHNHATQPLGQWCHRIYLEPRHCQPVRKFGGIEVGVNPFPEPVFRENHAGTSEKLRQKAQVIFKVQAKITDPIAQHGQAFHAHAKGKPLEALGVDSAHFQHTRMNHAATHDL